MLIVLFALVVLIPVGAASHTIRGAAVGGTRAGLRAGAVKAKARWDADLKNREKRRAHRHKRWESHYGWWGKRAVTADLTRMAAGRGVAYLWAFLTGAAGAAPQGARAGATRARQRHATGTRLVGSGDVTVGAPNGMPSTGQSMPRMSSPRPGGVSSPRPPEWHATGRVVEPDLIHEPARPRAHDRTAREEQPMSGTTGEVERVGDVRDRITAAIDAVNEAVEAVSAAQQGVTALPDELTSAGFDLGAASGTLTDLAAMDPVAGLEAWAEQAAQVAQAAQHIEDVFTDAAAQTGVQAGDVSVLTEA